MRRRLSFSVRVRAAARKHFARRIISLCLSAAGSERGKARRHTHSLRLCWEQEQQLAGDSPLANASNARRTRPRAASASYRKYSHSAAPALAAPFKQCHNDYAGARVSTHFLINLRRRVKIFIHSLQKDGRDGANLCTYL